MLKMNPIRLGAHSIEMRLIELGEEDKYGMADLRGLWEADPVTISVVDYSGSQNRVTVLHELIHAMFTMSGTHLSEDDQEHVCDVLGERFAEMFTRNTGFFKEW